jgi:protein-tyrosine-phosphatase
LRLLFLCTGNSARSQTAEAIARHLGAGEVEAFSAGTEPNAQVNPLAIETLRNMGLASDGLYPKTLSVFAGQHFDFIVTVCDRARENCPIFPNSKVTHWGLPDPAAELPETAPEAFQGTALDLWLRIRFLLEYVNVRGPTSPGATVSDDLLNFAAKALHIER